MKLFQLNREIWVPDRREAVFAFFADAANLQVLTPPWLNFRIDSPLPIAMRSGAHIAYHLRIWGLPVGWESEITRWDPPHEFVDEQVRGPYRRWIHRHLFRDERGGTAVRDEVSYAVPGGALINRLLVRPQLNAIFRYRHARLSEVFERSKEGASSYRRQEPPTGSSRPNLDVI